MKSGDCICATEHSNIPIHFINFYGQFKENFFESKKYRRDFSNKRKDNRKKKTHTHRIDNVRNRIGRQPGRVGPTTLFVCFFFILSLLINFYIMNGNTVSVPIEFVPMAANPSSQNDLTDITGVININDNNSKTLAHNNNHHHQYSEQDEYSTGEQFNVQCT